MPQLTGDINNDGVVDSIDLSILVLHWGTDNTSADLNNDGTVDSLDLSKLVSKWGNDTTGLPDTPSGITSSQDGLTAIISWGQVQGADHYQLLRSTTSGQGYYS